MAKTESHIPKLRFAGFSDPWNFFSLGKIFSQTTQYCDENDDIELWSLTVEKGLTPKTARYERSFLVKKDDGYKKIEPNEFVYNPMNMTIGAVGYNYTNQILAVSGYYVTMQIAKEQSISFFRSWLVSPNALGLYKQYATGSLIEKQRVQYVTFAKIKHYFPLLEEQTKIGDFFQKIDQVIELQQQALETAQDYKKSMLQKMFPQKGETVPKVRFDGFSGNWDNFKFLDTIEDIIDFRGRTPLKMGLDWSDDNHGYLALSALNVKQGYIDFNVDAHYGDDELYQKWMNGKELRKGQVLFTTEAPMGNVAQVPDNRGYILSQRTIAFITKNLIITDDFLACLLRSHLVIKELQSLASGGTATGVSQRSLSRLKIQIPKKIEEQQKIGVFFQKLDQ